MKCKIKAVILVTVLALLVIVAVLTLSGCSEASKVNYNINKQADYFESERRVTVYNARTDKVVMEIEGYISISNNTSNELIVTAKVGANQYKKNYVYLNQYVIYVVEDITGTHTDPYHYSLYIHNPDAISWELKP